MGYLRKAGNLPDIGTMTNDPSCSHPANRRPQVQALEGGLFALLCALPSGSTRRGAAGRDRGYHLVESTKVGFYQEIANA